MVMPMRVMIMVMPMRVMIMVMPMRVMIMVMPMRVMIMVMPMRVMIMVMPSGDDHGDAHAGEIMVMPMQGTCGRWPWWRTLKSSIRPVISTFSQWWSNSGIDFGVGTFVDGQTVLLLMVVASISLLVHIYSTEYVKGDRRYVHYYAFLSCSPSMLFVMAQTSSS